MGRCIGLEDALLNGGTNRDTDAYLELPSLYLAQELVMFRQAYQYRSTDEATTLFCRLPHECQRLFPHVEQLLRLLLVLPVSSASSERSFLGLRRLKRG
jgi:hAT family C-terminal dimerisation region